MFGIHYPQLEIESIWALGFPGLIVDQASCGALWGFGALVDN